MKVSLQSMINNRIDIDKEVILNIIDLFSKGQSKEKRYKIKSLLLNKFYTIFDGSPIAKALYIDSHNIFFTQYIINKEKVTLKSSREYILSFWEEE